MSQAQDGSGSRSPVASGRAGLPYLDKGTGELVVVLQNSSEQSALIEQLAQQFRVIACEPKSALDLSTAAAEIDQVASNLDAAGYSVIADSEHAGTGIALAASRGDRVKALVLVAPSAELLGGASDLGGLAANLRLEEITAPTLALFGTRQGEPAFQLGRTFARLIAKCFYTLVYDSGRAIGNDRPQALAALVLDFLERKDRFVVGQHGSGMNP